MKSIKVTIMGRQFPLKVDEADEEMMYGIADFVDQRIRTYKKELANQSESIILTLACLSIAEELFQDRRNAAQQVQSPAPSFDAAPVNRLLREILAEIR